MVFLVGPAPPVGGSVFYRGMVWLLPLVRSHVIAVMSSLRARYHTKYDVALFSLQTVPCPCSDAVLRSCEEALAGIILHRPPSLWFAWVRSGCAGPLRAAWGPGGRGPGGDIMGGGGGVGPGIREHTCLSVVCLPACLSVCLS